jgi:hypothetical protein
MSVVAGVVALSNLVSEFIEDPDKKSEIALEFKRLETDLDQALLGTVTTPKTDAFVKVLIAFRDIILPLLRPLGAAAMTGFAAYLTYHEIPIDGAVEAVLYGAFPAWGASRHANKQKEVEYTPHPASDWSDDFD